MALTLTEKQHWKNRIESKLGNRIRELRESQPELIGRFREAAIKDVRAGLEEDFSRLNELESIKRSTEEAVESLLAEIYEKVTGEAEDEVTRWMIDRRLSNLQNERFEQFLRDHELGQRIAEIENRREELNDSILLATNIQQIINIWDEVTTMLTDQPGETDESGELEDSLFAQAA